LRLLSGRGADRTGRYWPITIGGYVVQMAAVPLLALAGSWQVAALLIIAERVGKAARSPPRDAMLSHAAREMGYAFHFHRAATVHAPLVPVFYAVAMAVSGAGPLVFGRSRRDKPLTPPTVLLPRAFRAATLGASAEGPAVDRGTRRQRSLPEAGGWRLGPEPRSGLLSVRARSHRFTRA
jgi:hypothetical protein